MYDYISYSDYDYDDYDSYSGYDGYSSNYYSNPYSSSYNAKNTAGLLRLILGMGALMWIIIIASTVLICLGMWKSFKKARHDGWEALIPGHNMFVMFQDSGIKPYWIFLLLVPVANIVVPFWLNIEYAKSFGKSAGFGIGLTLLPVVFFPILGMGSAQYIGPAYKENNNNNVNYSYNTNNANNINNSYNANNNSNINNAYNTNNNSNSNINNTNNANNSYNQNTTESQVENNDPIKQPLENNIFNSQINSDETNNDTEDNNTDKNEQNNDNNMFN